MRCYCENLDTVPGIKIIDYDPEGAALLSTVLVENREGLRAKLEEYQIESGQSHYRNDRFTVFQQFEGHFPNMDTVESKYLCLPLHMHLRVEDVERVCSVIKSGW